MKYIEKLRKEFNLATGLNDYKSFMNWLNEKEIHLDRFSAVLDYLGFDYTEATIELDRGKFDTIMLLDFYPVIEISKYANTIESNSIINIKGELFIKNGDKMIMYNDYVTSPKLEIAKNYLVYLDEYNRKIYDLINLDKIIYYGCYGKVTDLDIKAKKRYLEEVKEKLNSLRCNVANCETTIDDTYVNILKIKKKLY